MIRLFFKVDTKLFILVSLSDGTDQGKHELFTFSSSKCEPAIAAMHGPHGLVQIGPDRAGRT